MHLLLPYFLSVIINRSRLKELYSLLIQFPLDWMTYLFQKKIALSFQMMFKKVDQKSAVNNHSVYLKFFGIC